MAMEVEQNQNHQLGFPFWKPLRHRFGPESPFFAPGNLERELLAKQKKSNSLRNGCKRKKEGTDPYIVGFILFTIREIQINAGT
ncbi:hypothetical protein GmHk_19G054806 [Glycine max]|uniref:Uncharacterized protein n=2 Tax=Glycine subgen. Soja TaxID=1462606 RepID=A0A0R0EK26_SOYBN|nr:hypothetical protein JHK86_052922 [Glycine max]KAG4915443.1 hypothetical protein JHK87_053000 [Glycine soja]KAH1077031.1 hypothetical protein GYH30_052507 [Glycine max]KAH1193864.1 hypothetical protein GmHk_19G054806 [Glycine max]RZB47129.1 hypothetical protein D0Y65_050952 [Glycine soja]